MILNSSCGSASLTTTQATTTLPTTTPKLTTTTMVTTNPTETTAVGPISIEAFVSTPDIVPHITIEQLIASKQKIDAFFGGPYYTERPDLAASYAPNDKNKLIQAVNFIKKLPWTYESNYFDCSEMTGLVEFILETFGFDTMIVVGSEEELTAKPGVHAWIVVLLRNPTFQIVPIEATRPGIVEVEQSVTYSNGTIMHYEDFFKSGWVVEDIYQAEAWYQGQFDWWNSYAITADDIFGKPPTTTTTTTSKTPTPTITITPTTTTASRPWEVIYADDDPGSFFLPGNLVIGLDFGREISEAERSQFEAGASITDSKNNRFECLALMTAGSMNITRQGKTYQFGPCVFFAFDIKSGIPDYTFSLEGWPPVNLGDPFSKPIYGSVIPTTTTTPPTTTPPTITLPTPTITVPPPTTLSVTFNGWFVNGTKVDSTSKGKTVVAKINLAGGSAGTYTIRIRRDISLATDETVQQLTFSYDGISTSKQISFVAAYTTGEAGTNGYHVDILKNDSTAWTMVNSYPPRLKVTS